MHISTILDDAVKLWPDKAAVVCGENRFSYSQFAKRTRLLADFMRSMGLNLRDRVGIVHHNCHVYLEAYFAAAYAGLVLVPINYRLSEKELAFIFQDSGIKILISHIDFRSKVENAISKPHDHNVNNMIWNGLGNSRHPEVDRILSHDYENILTTVNNYQLPQLKNGSDIAQLYYTSGTTGTPKGVILTHKNVVTHANGTVTEFQLNENDVWGHIAPLYHLADAWATFAITMVGGKHVIVPRFDPPLVLETIRTEGVTLSNLIPTMLNQLVNEPCAAGLYPSLRYILSGGAPIAPELVRKIISTFGCEYVQTYGMTETSPYLTVSLLKEHLKGLPDEQKFKYQAKTGRKFITVELKVIGPDDIEVEHNDTDVGEIWVRGPTITPGYWNKPEETAEAFEGGWLKTGDLATIDNEDYVNIVDRKKDLIVTGGENVYSTEVEHVLYEHPTVLEAAVIGVPDETWGEAVKAIVVIKSTKTSTEEELIAFCKARLTSYKVPKSVDFVPELPKTGTGKIYKKALKEKYWAKYDKRVH